MDISVILATYNRAHILRGTLASLAALRPGGITCEIIVVDNASTDETRGVVEEMAATAGGVPIRYVFEPRQGKNLALNTGMAAGTGMLFVFTDDDVFVPADWLERYWAAAQAHPEATYFGGSIRARLPATAPAWARTCGFDLVDHDFGEGDRRADRTVDQIAGPNMAVRRCVFDDGIRFDPMLGPVAGGGRRASEASLLCQLDARGDVGWIVAGAAVEHRIDVQPWMLSRRYQFKRHFNYAQGLVRAGEYWVGTRRVLGVRVGPACAAVGAVGSLVASRIPGRSMKARVHAERNVATTLGALVEMAAWKLERGPSPAQSGRAKRVAVPNEAKESTRGMSSILERAEKDWPPVVVAGAYTTAVVLMRDLSRRGLTTYCVGCDTTQPGFKTVYGRAVECPNPDRDSAGWLRFMQDLSRRLGTKPVLMPSADMYVSAMAAHAGALREHFVFPTESIQVQEMLATKRRQYAIASENGMPVPRTRVVGSAQELAAFSREALFPCVLKPIHSRHWELLPREHALWGKKVLLANSAAELSAGYRAAREASAEVVVQELIHGPDTAKLVYLSCYGRGSRRLGSCLVREIRTMPIHVGSASVVEPAVDVDAEAMCDAFLRRVGYEGLCEIELKRDSRDGQLKMIEANPRYSITSDAATYAGVELGWLHYLDLMGQHLPEVRQSGREFRHVVLERDVQCIGSYWRAGLLTGRGLLQSYRPAVVFFDFDPRDTRVAIGLLGDLVRIVLSRMRRRLFPKAPPRQTAPDANSAGDAVAPPVAMAGLNPGSE